MRRRVLLLVLGLTLVGAAPASADIVYSGRWCESQAAPPPNAPPGPRYCPIVIWRAADDGSGVRRLTDGPLDADPVWSPDGRRIAFTRQRSDPDGFATRVWTMDAEGGDLRQLTPTPRSSGGQRPEDSTPAWSPDGQTIAFASRRGLADPDAFTGGGSHIWTIRPDGQGLRPLTTGAGTQTSPAFSPDGLRVAYVAGASPPYTTGIETVPVTGGPGLPVTLGDLPLGAFALAFSPDGRRLAFSLAGRLHTVSALGGAPERLTDEFAGSVAWSGSPAAIYYTSSNGSEDVIRRIPAGGGEPRSVALGGSPDWHGPQLLGPVADALAPVTAILPPLPQSPPRPARAAARRPRPPRLPLLVADPSGVRSLRAAVARRSGGGCRFAARGRLGPARSCAARGWFAVRDGRAWRAATGRLPRGRYRVWLMARDGEGNRSRRPRAQDVTLR